MIFLFHIFSIITLFLSNSEHRNWVNEKNHLTIHSWANKVPAFYFKWEKFPELVAAWKSLVVRGTSRIFIILHMLFRIETICTSVISPSLPLIPPPFFFFFKLNQFGIKKLIKLILTALFKTKQKKGGGVGRELLFWWWYWSTKNNLGDSMYIVSAVFRRWTEKNFTVCFYPLKMLIFLVRKMFYCVLSVRQCDLKSAYRWLEVSLVFIPGRICHVEDDLMAV